MNTDNETIMIDTVNGYGIPIRTMISLTREEVLTIKEGVIREDYAEGVSWHSEIVLSGVKLERLREIICKKGGVRNANNKRKID